MKNRGFRQLTTAWFSTNIGDSFIFLVLAIWVKDLTGSNTAAGLTFVMLGLPALVAPFLGDLADRVSRRNALIAANALMAVIMCALFLVNDPSGVWLIQATIFAYGTMNYLSAAAQGGLVRDILPDEHLAQGNGILSTIDQAMRLAIPVVGTGLYVTAGPHAAVAVTVVAFGLAAILMLRVKVVETPPAKREPGTFVKEFTAGFRHLFVTKPLNISVLVIALAFGVSGLVNVSIFPLLEDGLGMSAAALGFIAPIQGVGSVLGGLTAARAIKRLGEVPTVMIGLLLLGIGLIPATIPWHPVSVFLGLAVLGFGVLWTVVAFMTMRQRLTPPTLQGRVGSASGVALNVPQLLGTVVATAVVGYVDYRWLVGGTVVGCLGAGMLGLIYWIRRGSRPMTEASAGTADEAAMDHTDHGLEQVMAEAGVPEMAEPPLLTHAAPTPSGLRTEGEVDTVEPEPELDNPSKQVPSAHRDPADLAEWPTTSIHPHHLLR